MMPLRPPGPSWPGLLLLAAVLAAYAHTAQPAEPRVVCYYTNWSVYRPGNAKFSPQNINPYLCTHLIYSFGGFTKDNALKPFDKYQDIEKGGYAKFTGLKTYNKNLKCMLAIGGWNEGSGRFSPLVASAERRQQFTKNAIKFLRQNHFDGLDLDWEYPAHRDGGKPRDRDNYAQFVQELREEFERESSKTGKPRLLLTMAVPAGVETVKKGYDVRRLNKYLDWFNLLTYDYHSSFEPSVNHHAPLMALEEDDEYNYDAELNIDYSIKYYLNEGADREKLVLGIPTYGRSYTLLNEESTDIGAPTDGPGDQGDATREKGYLAYYEICQSLKEEEGWTVVQPNPKAMGPYAFRGNQWVGYDDEQIVRRKGEYVVANGLGGIMFWAIDNDDFRGTCTGKAYPLIEAAKDAMLSGLGLGDNDVVAPVAGPHKKPPRSRSRQGTTSVNRVEAASKDKEVAKRPATRRPATRRKPASTTESSSYAETAARAAASRTTTPAPPTTPDPGGDFKCEDEGFFSHPRDCTKYFWCLDSGASNLGIVANPFSCPTGLVFNKHSESCDYPRNVECTTKTKAPKPIEVTTPLPSTTAAPTSARPSRIITTRKSTTSTTTELPEEEYDDEDEELPQQFHETLDEEDPKVIKELIDLIKRVGGIEKLERHLSIDGPTSTNVSGEKTDAQPLISKTLYNKVLNSASGRSFMPRNRYTFSTNRTGTVSSNSGSSSVTEGSAVLVQSAVSGNKYSSVIRNSRPSAQSDGIDRVAAVQQKSTAEAKVGGRPQYVTIQRPSTKPREESDEEDDAADDEDDAEEVVADDDEEDEDEDTDTDTRVSSKRTSTTTTSHTQYVNIQRNRGSTTAKPTDTEDEDEVEEEDVPQHKKYSTLERRRNPAQLQTSEEKSESEEKKSSVGAISYNTIDRHRTADQQSGVSVEAADPETTVPQSNLANLTDNNDTPTTTTTNTTTTITTREYSSVARRTTTTTDTPPILSTTTTTTTTAPITDTTLTAASVDDELSVGATTSASVVEIDDSVSATAVSGGSVDIDLDTDLRPLTTTEQPADIVTSTERRRRPSTTTGSSSTSAESAATSAPSSSTVGIISSNTFSDSTLSVKDTTTTTITQTGADSSAPAGDAFLASVSSPRPFSIAKRTRRPFGGPKVSSSTTSETLTADVEGSVEAGVNKVSSTSTTVLLSASGNKKHALGSLLSVRSHALGAQRVESGQHLQQEQPEQSAQSLGTVDEVSTKVVTNRTTTYSSIRGVKPIRRTRPSLNRLQTTETSAEVSDADVVVQSQPSPPVRKTYASRPNRFQTTEASAEVSEDDRDVVEPKPQRPSFVATRPNRFRLQEARVSTTSTESGDAAALGEEQPLPTTRVVPRRRFRPRFDADTFGQNEFGGGGYETTTKFVERLLRPEIGNDLSSLTAVDFGRSSGDTSRAPSRRIWPNRSRGPSSSTTPIVYDEVVQDRGETRPTRPVLRATTPIPRVSENEDAPVTARTRRPIGTRRLSTSTATSPTTTTAPEPEIVNTSTVASTATSKLSALFANRPKPFLFGRTSTESSAEIQLEEEDEATTVINDSLVASAHRNYNHLEGNVNVVVENTFETVRTDGKPLRRKFTDSPIFFLKSGRTTTSPLLGPLLVFNTLSKEVDDSVNENYVTEKVEDIEVNTQNAVIETEIPTERSESAEDVTLTVAPELFNESEEEVTATVAPRVAIRHPSIRITTLPPAVSSEESETETEQPDIVTEPQSTTVTTARTAFRRPSFRTTASPSDIPSEAPIVVVTRGRRPLIRSTTTTVPTTSETSGESENVRTSHVRQRPSFRLSTGSRTTTTSSEIVDESHVEEHNDVSVVAVNQVRQRPAFNRRPFATRTTPKSGEEEQNGESQADIDETNVEEHNEVSVVAVNQVRQRPAFNRRPFATRTTPKSDEEDQNIESQTDVDETHVEEHNEVSVITRNTVRQRPSFNRRPIGTRTTPKSSEEDLNSELQATVDETLVEEHNDESIVTRNQVRQRPALIRRPFTTRTTPKSDEDINTESQAAVDETLVEEQNDVSVLTRNQVRQRPAFNRRPFNTRTTPKSDDEELISESQTDIAETHEEDHNDVSVITRNQVRQRPAFNPRPLRTRTTPKSEEVESETDSVDVNEVNEVHEVRQRPTFNRRPTLEAAEPVEIEAKTTISELSRSRFNSKRFKPETFVTTEGALTSEINEESTSTLTSRAPIEVTSTESVDAADETTVEAETEIPATEKPKRRRKVIRRRRPVATVDEKIASDSSAVIKSDVELTLSTELPTASSKPTFRPLLRRTTTEDPEESSSLSSVDPAEYSSTTEVGLEDASTLSSIEPLESSTTFTRSPIRTILRRTSTTTETPLSDEPATYNDQPNTTNIEVLPVRGYFRPAASAVATDESSTSAESSTLRHAKGFSPSSNAFQRKRPQSIQEHIATDSTEVEDEHEENNNIEHKDAGSDRVAVTPSTSTTRPVFTRAGSRVPFRPTRPTSSVTATTASSVDATSARTFVRKFSSKFQLSSRPEVQDNVDGDLIGRVKPFGLPVQRPSSVSHFRNTFKQLDDGNDGDYDDEEYVNSAEQFNDDDEEDEDHDSEEDSRPVLRPSFPIASKRPTYNNRFNLNREEPALVAPKIRPSLLAATAQGETEDADDEPVVHTQPQYNRFQPPVQATKRPAVAVNRPKFGAAPARKQNVPYAARRPTTPASRVDAEAANALLADLDRNALNSRNKAIFEKNNKKHYSNTPLTNPYNISSNNTNNNNTTSTPSTSTDQQHNLPSISTSSTNEHLHHQFTTESYTNTFMTTTTTDTDDDDATASTQSLGQLLVETLFGGDEADDQTNAIILNEFQNGDEEAASFSTVSATESAAGAETTTNSAVETTSTYTNTFRPRAERPTTTTTQKPTTLHHIFAVDYDDQTEATATAASTPTVDPATVATTTYIPDVAVTDTVEPPAELITHKLEKLAEVSRIVEISSQQQTQHSNELRSPASDVIIEKKPTLETLGEISRLTLIKLVERQIDTVRGERRDHRQLVLPEQIFSVETSTIPLEALFDRDRAAKQLSLDEAILGTVATGTTTTSTAAPVATTVATSTPDSGDVVTTTETSQQVHSLAPQLRPESNESIPLVISIANLDQVILSKKPTDGNGNGGDDDDVAHQTRVVFRPTVAARRPSLSVQKYRPTTTTTTTTTTASPADVPPDATPATFVRKRGRPVVRTASSTTTTPAPTSFSATTTAAFKRKYSADRVRFSTTTSATTTSTAATTVVDPKRTSNPQFRRRFGYSAVPTVAPTRASTSYPTRAASSFRTSTTPSGGTKTVVTLTTTATTTTPSPDQSIEPSHQDSKFTNARFNQIGEVLSDDLIEAITKISRAPLPARLQASTLKYDAVEHTHGEDSYEEPAEDVFFTRPFQRIGISTTKRSTAKRPTGKPQPAVQSLKVLKPSAFKATIPPGALRASNTPAPPPTTTATRRPSYVRPYSVPPVSTLYTASLAASLPTVGYTRPTAAALTTRRDFLQKQRRSKPFTGKVPPADGRSLNSAASADEDYFEVASRRGDLASVTPSTVPKTNSTKVKVILHDAGLIECLDQGNFPHPLSCRKFISCAKMEIGGVVGWEYTCPKGLSYDPVGGICNWAAGLGCNE